MLFEKVYDNGFGKHNFYNGDAVLFKNIGIDMLSAINIDGIINFIYDSGNRLRSKFHKIILAERKRFIVHPQERSLDFLVASDVSVFGEHATS